jgi:hypothetical protein
MKGLGGIDPRELFERGHNPDLAIPPPRHLNWPSFWTILFLLLLVSSLLYLRMYW